MSFRVTITPPPKLKTDPYPTEEQPLLTREAASASALRALSLEGVRFGIAGLTFARRIAELPLGEEIKHEESGYSIRTEEI